MSRQMPNLYFFMNGTHVHHLNYGIFLLAGVAAYLLFMERTPRTCKFAALGYGIAMALTFDEFGMWLHLGGSYWQRASVDAIIIVAAVLALVGFGSAIRNFESRHLQGFDCPADRLDRIRRRAVRRLDSTGQNGWAPTRGSGS